LAAAVPMLQNGWVAVPGPVSEQEEEVLSTV
jgi:hypothetical protein